MRALLAILLCAAAGAQSLPPSEFFLASGSAVPVLNGNPADVPPPQQFQADQYFNGGAPWSDPTMGSGIWSTLRFAPSFSYDIPAPNGFYTVKFDMLEPNKTAAKQRVFSILANGVQSDPIDLFAATGGINIQTSTTLLVMVGNGHLRISFQATVGNAVVTAIEVTRSVIFAGVQTVYVKLYTCNPPLSDTNCVIIPDPVPAQPASIQWFKCTGSPACQGIELLHVRLSNGTAVDRFAEPVPSWAILDPSKWASVNPN